MRQMKPLLKYNSPSPYTWSYEFDTFLVGGHKGDSEYSSWHDNWWMSSCDCPFNEAGIPFWVPKGASLEVNWGDGSIETITGQYTKEYAASNVESVLASGSGTLHTYSIRGTYTISITSSQWDKIWLCGGDPGNGGFPLGGYPAGHWNRHYAPQAAEMYDNPDWWGAYDCGFDYGSGFSGSITGGVAAMRMGCIKIFNPLPPVAGILVSDYIHTEDNDRDRTPEGYFDGIPEFGTFLPNSLYYAFAYYFQVLEMPKDVFRYNQHICDFTGCLWEMHPILQSTTNYDKSRSRNFISSYIATQ